MSAVPPKIASSAVDNRRWVLLLLAAAALALGATVYFFNPATHPFYPICQFHRLTGLNCPGCGMTRATHALLHGELAAALRQNALLVTVAGLFLLRGAWMGFNRLRGKPNGEFFPVKYLWPLLAAAVGFAVLRNLPACAFLAP
jgi:hypothetical protein